MKNIFILAILFFATLSCKDNAAGPQSSGLVGKWENVAFQNISAELPNGGALLKRSNRLPERNYGYEFKAKGKLISIESAGWCGTPMTYGTFTGTWSVDNDILTLRKKYWGGDEVRTFKIVRLDNKELTISYIY